MECMSSNRLLDRTYSTRSVATEQHDVRKSVELKRNPSRNGEKKQLKWDVSNKTPQRTDANVKGAFI